MMNENARQVENGSPGQDMSATSGSDALRTRLVVLLTAGIILCFVAYLLLTPHKNPLPKWNRPVLGHTILTWFWAVLLGLPGLALARIAFHGKRARMMRGVKRLVLCFISSCVMIVALDVIVSEFPALQGSFVPKNLLWAAGNMGTVEDQKYGFKGRPLAHSAYVFDPVRDGLLTGLVAPGRIEAAGEDKKTYTIRHDKNGFPNSEVPDTADWIIIGDSFADEMLASDEKGWVTLLRDNLKGGVYDMAVPGWGPQQEKLALDEYAFAMKPRTVI
jgi:hypothetical protein